MLHKSAAMHDNQKEKKAALCPKSSATIAEISQCQKKTNKKIVTETSTKKWSQ